MGSISDAEATAKLALLKKIEALAPNLSTASGLKDLALAYALTVGAKWGDLPGGGIDVKVSK